MRRPGADPAPAGSRARAVDLLVAAGAGAAWALAAVLEPVAGGLRFPSGAPLGELCLFHAATGHDCPLCGLTRSFAALAHGDPAASFAFHPAGPFVALAAVALVLVPLALALRRAPPLSDRPSFRWVLPRAAVALLAVGALRLAWS